MKAESTPKNRAHTQVRPYQRRRAMPNLNETDCLIALLPDRLIAWLYSVYYKCTKPPPHFSPRK
jgi:hypothetical protein